MTAGDDAQIATREVPNPDHAELQALLAQARRAASVHGAQLDRAALLMGQDRVWTGPAAASGFAAELQGRKGAVSARFAEFVEEVEHRLRSTPATVTASTRVW